ncbi:hypothetical protein TNCT_727661 [Trichonephila clavata]|uniref:Uncharacterized protein n=1 Tax=Trichonephila clavata TaxID=2740835 RepID=A0A8X6GH87_TRICU|nr:hypothetical protein TNCT_727661 [Trichonephila clavata]
MKQNATNEISRDPETIQSSRKKISEHTNSQHGIRTQPFFILRDKPLEFQKLSQERRFNTTKTNLILNSFRPEGMDIYLNFSVFPYWEETCILQDVNNSKNNSSKEVFVSEKRDTL